eukprot:TRINITY_DN26062_c0_g2_i1.p1 TRINITY_DN26062_c0_g2~~TRINITY_DN26062_c0_g2_i1.p1  ORF type:complete len:680 (+),score=114.42 TRINITY_DN26062_c0_g2_i1:74-2113(+)
MPFYLPFGGRGSSSPSAAGTPAAASGVVGAASSASGASGGGRAGGDAEKTLQLLHQLYEALDRREPVCFCRRKGDDGTAFIDFSLLTNALVQVFVADVGEAPSSRRVVGGWSWNLLSAACEDPGCNAAVGSLVGMAVGDSLGAPLEFSAVDEHVIRDGFYFSGGGNSRPHLAGVREGRLNYVRAKNSFGVCHGQWTDDTSMGLCLADSLLARGRWHGGDARLRWHMWWNHGYCNAFRYDMERGRGRLGRSSIGLGGNISKSLMDVERAVAYSGEAGDEGHAELVPPIYQSTNADAGNGSIMRLAPVAIAYHLCWPQAVDVASWQSLATHPGGDAVACCRFLAFFLVAAYSAHRECHENPGACNPARDPRRFLDLQIDRFLKSCADSAVSASVEEVAISAFVCPVEESSLNLLTALLRCKPPSEKEAHWDWKQEELRINAAILARCGPRGDGLYNGYPVLPGYFGSYCMDGLAMALWALWHADNFSSCIKLAVNLLGDADTVAAIAGQMAGAVFGYNGILADELGRRAVSNLSYWDPLAEVGLRAALLFHHGPQMRAKLCQAEGHPSVRAFQKPETGAAIVGEVPSGSWVDIVNISPKFRCIRWRREDTGSRESVEGWVGVKNIASIAPAVGTEELRSWLPSRAPGGSMAGWQPPEGLSEDGSFSRRTSSTPPSLSRGSQ